METVSAALAQSAPFSPPHSSSTAVGCAPHDDDTSSPLYLALHSRKVLFHAPNTPSSNNGKMASTSSDAFPAKSCLSSLPPPQEAILIISRESGRIIDIIYDEKGKDTFSTSTRLSIPALLAPQCRYIDLKSALIMPGAVDIYTGTCREQTGSPLEAPTPPSTGAIGRSVTDVTRTAAISGITTLVESPNAAGFSPSLADLPSTDIPGICSTASSLTRRWQLLNDDTCIPKHVDYGLLAAVDPARLNEIGAIAESGYALGLFCVIGAPIGAPGTCPAPVEALKVPRIARTAAEGGMRGSLFVRAETYTPKQLRLASPLRTKCVSDRRVPELKINHPAYMLGGGAEDVKLGESLGSSNGSDQFSPRMARSAAMDVPFKDTSSSAEGVTSSGDSGSRVGDSDVARGIRRTGATSVGAHLNHRESNHSNYDSTSHTSANVFRLSVTPTQSTFNFDGRMSPSMLRLRSPTVQSLGRRTHSFNFGSRSVDSSTKRSSSSGARAPTPNRAFVSALLSEELKSYGQQQTFHKSNMREAENFVSSSPPNPISSDSGHFSSIQRLEEERTSRSISPDIGGEMQDRPSFELMVQFQSDRLKAEARAEFKEYNDTASLANDKGLHPPPPVSSLSGRPVFSPPVPIPTIATSSMPSSYMWTTKSMANQEIVRQQRADLWGDLVPPGPDEFPISPPKISNLSKMPSLLARRRAAAAAKAGSVLLTGCGGSDVGEGAIQNTGPAMSATISVVKHGNPADAQGALFNLRPLSLYKVPDTLTSAAICANYAIYLSQRPEKAEVDAVRSVLEGMPPPEERASDNHKDESRINDDIVRSNHSTAGQANVFNTVRAGGSVIDCSNNMTRTPKTQTPLRVHFCGLSSALAVSTIEARRREGREDISCGTAPHYLMSSSEILPPGCTLAKCSPPIRDGENMRMLRESVTTGAVTTLASWHLEFEPRQKMLHSGDLIRSIGGIDSMETLVPACWTFCRDVGLGPEVMGALLSKAPADSLGLGGTKGSIRVGVMADLCVIDLEATTSFASMNATNLLKSLRIPLRGRILQTWVRGHCVFNLADKALMSESAVSVTSSFTGARRKKREENSINPGTYGRMIRANKGKTKN